MVKSLIELLTRLVVAIEIIASKEDTVQVTGSTEPEIDISSSAKRSEVTKPEMSMSRDYDQMAEMAKDDKSARSALEQLCAERGIEVPPRTKSTTLAKSLKAWDLMNPEGVATPPAEVQSDPAPVPEETTDTVDDDPFGLLGDTQDSTPPVVYTLDDVRTVFTAWASEIEPADRNARITAVLTKYGRAANLSAVSPADYPALMDFLKGGS